MIGFSVPPSNPCSQHDRLALASWAAWSTPGQPVHGRATPKAGESPTGGRLKNSSGRCPKPSLRGNCTVQAPRMEPFQGGGFTVKAGGLSPGNRMASRVVFGRCYRENGEYGRACHPNASRPIKPLTRRERLTHEHERCSSRRTGVDPIDPQAIKLCFRYCPYPSKEPIRAEKGEFSLPMRRSVRPNRRASIFLCRLHFASMAYPACCSRHRSLPCRSLVSLWWALVLRPVDVESVSSQ